MNLESLKVLLKALRTYEHKLQKRYDHAVNNRDRSEPATINAILDSKSELDVLSPIIKDTAKKVDAEIQKLIPASPQEKPKTAAK